MNARFFGLLGVVLAGGMGVGCKEDPTAELAGKEARVDFQFAYREVVVAESVRTFVAAYDALTAPVPASFTVSSLNSAIATVGLVSDAPLSRQGVQIRGVAYGTTKIVARSAGGRADTMDVATFPARVNVTGPDTVISGATAPYIYAYFAANNADITAQGIPAPIWRTNIEERGTTTQAGVLSGFDPSVVNLTAVAARGPGADSLRFTKTVFVDPRPFRGTTGTLDGVPTDTVRFERAVGAPKFNQGSDLAVTFSFLAVPTFVARRTADSLYVIVPPIGEIGPGDLVITRADSAKTAEKVSFNSTTTSLLDHQDPASDDPSTAPSLSANGDYYVALSGVCQDGSVTAPADDCDDFFTVANPSATDTLRARVVLDWPGPSDVDILWCRNVGCTSVTAGGGATAANPEVSNVKIPPSATWYLWLNFFDPVGIKAIVARARVSGFP